MRGEAVQVFIDDFVQDRLPRVCVRTGVATNERVRVQGTTGGSSALLLLLVFFGPMGWLVLLILMRPSEKFTGVVAMSEPAYADLRWRRRQALAAILLSLVAFVLVLALAPPEMMGELVIATLVTGGIATAVTVARANGREVKTTIDASRRWVTIHDAHPAFAAAVRAAGQPDRSYA